MICWAVCLADWCIKNIQKVVFGFIQEKNNSTTISRLMYVSYKQRNKKENPDQQQQHERGRNGTVDIRISDRLAYEITFI